MTEQNTLSISELQQQANAGNAQAQLDLAWRYLRNDKDKETALMWLNKAAEQGLASGQLALGLYYFQGINKDLVNKAKTSLFADENTALTGAIVMHLKDGKDAGLAFTWFKKAAKQHCAEAQYLLAVCYRDGIGIKQNDQLAFAWFGKAAEQGFAAAQCGLGRSYHEGKGVEQNNERALAWLNKAVEQTDAYIADVDLCEPSILQHCQKVSLDHSKCAPEAYLLLGERYAQGKGAEQCDETAFKWYQKAAEMNVAEAQYRLALCCFEGKGVAKDYGLGMKWLREAVIQNHEAANAWLENAYLRLAFPHLVGKENAEGDYQFAFDWCRKEAEQDSAEVYLCLGILYRFGKGVEQNDERAFECFSKADNLYDCDSDKNGELYFIICLILGICYAQGKGVGKDISKAERCFGNDFYNEYGAGQILDQKRKVETVSNGHSLLIVPIPLLTVELLLNSNRLESAKNFVEEANIDRQSKKLYSAWISREEQLESEMRKKESLEQKMQKLVEQFTHTLGNVIFPDTIYQVAERLKNNPECRKDVLLLHEAYHSEIIIKLQGELLRQRYTNTNPEQFRQFIRKCRQTLNSAENTKSIEDILDYAASRVTARFLNQYYAGLTSIRDNILSKKNVSLDALKQKFEDDILLNKSLRPIAWVNQNLRPIQITEISPLWKKVFILSESHAEALLFGYFSEILFNAFKYADHDKDEFLTLDFDEKNIDDKTYLTCSWQNPVKDKSPSMLGTGKGLDAIKEDLKQLNDVENPEESLLISQQKNQFQVTLFFKKDLLVNELPSLKIKRKANVE